jgi:hypothetical protein
MQEERSDPLTGEIISAEPERAQDGAIIPHPANTAGDILNMLEDGRLSVDIVRDMKPLIAKMEELAEASGKTQKGKLTITIDLACDGQIFTATGGYKITPPKEPRPKTLVFVTDEHQLTRTQPRQRQFFGIRQVGGSEGPVRRV